MESERRPPRVERGGASTPGWFSDPVCGHPLRWWDGSRWTEWISDGHLVAWDGFAAEAGSRPPDSGPTEDGTYRVGFAWPAVVVGLMVAGLALSFGPWAGGEGHGEPCSDSWLNATLGGPHWVIWGLLVVLAVAGLLIWVSRLVVALKARPVSTDDRVLLGVMGVLVALGWVTAITMFPVVLWAANGLNCGL